MSRYTVRVRCGHQDCAEYNLYAADTRREQADIYARHGNGKYRCVRHSRPAEVLSPGNRKLVAEIASRKEPSGLYWGSSGFIYGPGFKAFANDFPPGTTIRVTAEIIIPEATDDA